MSTPGANHIPGFEAPLHRALTEPILLSGAPRAIAIVNGTVAAALGLGLQMWIAGLVLWLAGHSLAVFAAKRDPEFHCARSSVFARGMVTSC
jgi:type IV secretion system protein VirB3